MGVDIRDLDESFWPIKMLIPEANSYKKSALAYRNAVNGTSLIAVQLCKREEKKTENGN